MKRNQFYLPLVIPGEHEGRPPAPPASVPPPAPPAPLPASPVSPGQDPGGDHAEAVMQAEFNEWIAANPALWKLFVEFSFQMIGRGYENYSSDAVCHRVRWQTDLETVGGPEIDGDRFKVCNNYMPYLARKFHHDYPEHKGFFRLRAVKMLPPILKP